MTNFMLSGYQNQPVVGMGATELCWTDRHPYTVIEVKSANVIVVQADDCVRIDNNGMSEDQRYEFKANLNGRKAVLRRAKNGRWYSKGGMHNGTCYSIGERDSYHDFSF